ncbi:glutathione S-transferase domain-containing protein [Actinobacillus lignieresii]|uniref:glutathione S-transferase family protein n=1 Tax=Actinobacillus lignieresii TaxID=720 RepID=UPI000E15AF9F|nr:glutathione S-transferase [Actinobacillus lignieresii]SUT98505.1 glutathione S-transferase domain-containing protein [Actinobacillus lignieresii]
MITLHYLKQSCSHRIVWLLEALGVDYELKIYDRLEGTGFAPEELKAQHPLGKAPVLQDGDLVLAEGNAIIQHLLDRYDTENRFTPAHKTDAYSNYVYWLAISASMFSANLLALVSKKGDLGDFAQYANAQVGLYFNHVEKSLEGKTWIVGEQLTGADFSLSFPLQWGLNYVNKADYPNIIHYLEQIETHPAYLKANEKTAGGLELSRF